MKRLTRKECIAWYLKTKPPDQPFTISHPDLDSSYQVVRYKKFWESVGEILRVPERVDLWEDGTLAELTRMLMDAQKGFYLPIRGQEGNLPFEMREPEPKVEDLDF